MHPLSLTFGAFAATFAASAYCILLNKVLNFLTNSSSAPARLFLTARRRAKSGFWSTLVMYGIMLSSSTLTDNTYKEKVLSLENLQDRKLYTLHVQPFLEGIFTQNVFPQIPELPQWKMESCKVVRTKLADWLCILVCGWIYKTVLLEILKGGAQCSEPVKSRVPSMWASMKKLRVSSHPGVKVRC